MFPINSKTCTKVSKCFLIGSVFLLAWLMIILFSNILEGDIVVVYYLSCLLSGISFIFATGTHLDSLKGWGMFVHFSSCLLYTSDAADEEDSVDLGCLRIIKKKIYKSDAANE